MGIMTSINICEIRYHLWYSNSKKGDVHTKKSKLVAMTPAQFWKIFKEFGASKKVCESDCILGVKDENNALTSNNDEIVNVFNDYFVNVASKLKMPINPSTFEQLAHFVNSKVSTDIK